MVVEHMVEEATRKDIKKKLGCETPWNCFYNDVLTVVGANNQSYIKLLVLEQST